MEVGTARVDSTKDRGEGILNTIGFGAICSLASALLLMRLHSFSFWADELGTVELVTSSVGEILSKPVTDLHPPLYFLLLHLWSLFAGTTEFALRYFSVAAGLLGLAATFTLGKRLWDNRIGLAAVFLVTISPFFLLYSRMARYYSFTLLLALLSVLVFLKLLTQESRLHLGIYVFIGTLLIYTDYPAVSVLVTQNLFVLMLYCLRRRPGGWDAFSLLGFEVSRRDKEPRHFRWASPTVGTAFFRDWIVAQLALVALYLPWLGTAVKSTRVAQAWGQADFAQGWFGYIPKLAFPFYSFSVGETLFPWHPVAPLVLVAFAALGAIGFWLLMRNRPDSAAMLLGFLVIPLVATTLIVTYVSTGTTFLNIPSRTMFAFPFFILIVSAGVLYKRDARIQGLALMVIVLGSALSLANYHRGLQVFNPIYVVPVREVVQGLSEQARPGDVFIGEHDIGFAQYYHPSAGSPPYFRADSEEAVRYLVKEKSPRVWLVTFGRDRTRLSANTLPPLQSLLASDYHLESSKGYVEQDPTYRRFKELLLRRPAYRYKLLVEMYVRDG